MSVYDKWERYHIKDNHDLSKMVRYFMQDQPKTGSFDTETTGLHIIYDKPFLYQFGWLVPKQEGGKVFTFYPTQENMRVFLDLAKRLKYLVLWNAKFDVHMTTNIGYEKDVLELNNLVEGMVVARLALEAIPARDGGDSLKLKSIGVKYVDLQAANSEELIKEQLHELNLKRVQVLAAALKQFDHPTEKAYKPIRLDTGKPTTTPYATKNPDNVEWKWIPKKWGKGLVEKFLKDPTHDVEDLPEDVRDVYITWKEEYPEPTYADIDRELMIKYGGEDVITTLEFFNHAFPYVLKRNQLKILDQESRVILPLYKMERVGLKTDRKYLEESRLRVKEYIKKLRKELYEIAGEVVNASQNERIKEIYAEKWGIVLEKANKKVIKDIIEETTGDPKRFATLIKSLRSLEKWYSTYIRRVLESSKHDGRAYTQLHQNSAVSGRMSSDFQQFPKDGLFDLDGNELFHPRKAFVSDGKTYYIDYSQVELRSQADYTIKVSGGDLNLTRAYMPFKCHRVEDGKKIPYDFRSITGRREWDKYDWYLDERPNEKWEPTDVHGSTTHNALTLLGYETIKPFEEYRYTGTGEPFFKAHIKADDYKLIRGKGKTFNFMKNYGGGLGAAMEQLNLSREVSQALIDGYAQAFPEVVTYQKAVERSHGKKGYVENMYGRRYYLSDTNKAYKLANYLIQGTCADALKHAIIKIDEYIASEGIKSKMIIPIHDEIQFLVEEGEEHHVYEFKRIMEEVFESWCLVPIVADLEVTTTTWKAKEEIK